MRILLLTQYFPPETGAPQVRLWSMARCLVRQGHEVEVVTAMPNHPMGRIADGYRGRLVMSERIEGMRVHRVWLVAAVGGGLKRIVNYLSFAATCALGLLRLRRRPDLIFVESPPPFLAITARAYGRWHRVPYAFNVADLWPDSIREMGFIGPGVRLRLLERLERWCYARAGTVVAVTEGIRSDLELRKGVDPATISFLPNGVDPELFSPQQPDLELARELGLEGKRLVVYAGTVGFAQGLDCAILACEQLAAEHPDLVLVLLGGGSDRARLEALVAERGIGNVRFMDPRPPEFVPRLLSLAAAGLVSLKALPLFEGARPSKLFPVMACAKPVVYSGSGEGARMVSAAGAGWVAGPEDPDQLAAALRAILGDDDEARRRGEAGRRFVVAELTWERNVATWLGCIAGIRGARRG